MKLSERYPAPADIPEIVPVFPLAGALLLPRGQLPLNIFEPRYLAMIDDAMRGDKLIGMIQPDRGNSDKGVPELARIGTLGRITTWAESDDDRLLITLAGITRFNVIAEVTDSTPYRVVRANYKDFADDLIYDPDAEQIDRDRLLATLKDFVEAQDLSIDWADISEASDEALVNGLSMLSPYGPDEKQALLEVREIGERAELLIALTEMFLRRDSGADPARLQ
jgi:uncharacterized protein